MNELKLGEKAPDFNLLSTDGGLFSFSDHQKGHKAWHLIIFFRGEWCPACNDYLEEIEKSTEKFANQHTHIVAISSDEIDRLKELVSAKSLSFPVLSDKDRAAVRGYGVYIHKEDGPYEDHGDHNEPAVFLVDDKGNLLFQQKQTGPFGRPSPHDLGKTIKYISKNLR
ncbi:peroxiredoxin [Scopulibacillus darangshiensis]|uniref:Peroxiredoxin n=2 Tax=Scopulibacillus darangshiensis TaxID=442528 RepID=A0A4R2NWX1_9BACL|nr:peroxiredoxin [Scopulibacillus darangshiensis]